MDYQLNDDIARILTTDGYGDPFSVLGFHHTQDGNSLIRAFVPDAEKVVIVRQKGHKVIGEMTKTHKAGIFQYNFDEKTSYFPYELSVVNQDKSTYTYIDSYQFPQVLSEEDCYLIGQGEQRNLFKKLGAHVMNFEKTDGVHFGVWAPNARRVSVVGAFNNWDGRRHVMRPIGTTGIWEIFIAGLKEGDLYKYEILSQKGQIMPLKSDPVGFYQEKRPRTASIVYDLTKYRWKDKKWISSGRKKANDIKAPVSIYEVHLGSWRYNEAENRPLTYREMAEELIPYVKKTGFTHVEFLPPSEHPFDGSWGYQVIGMYAPTSRYGTPDDFKFLIDSLHQAGIAVIIDWVPAHFPKDDNGLSCFDGTCLYEHEDKRKGEHLGWGTKIYNFGRKEVSNFLISNALFWILEYHVDGLRVDAVASMLYLDYGRNGDDWIPNQYGGRENLEAIDFIRKLNEEVYALNQNVITCAEESTSWPMVSRPTYVGGLGFTFKWNMGWMHDTLDYMHTDPVHRKYRQNELTFSFVYAFSENFILPLSHDEVVHGKGPLWDKMPGDLWQKMANLRAYYGFMYAHPGKKLLFQGGEFAQNIEWHFDQNLKWDLLNIPSHKGVQDLIVDLNKLYRENAFLGEWDCSPDGFEWIDGSDVDRSVISFIRKGKKKNEMMICVSNFTPVVRHNYLVGTPVNGLYEEVLNTDDLLYGGSGVVNSGVLESSSNGWNFKPYALNLTLPPLATIFIKLKTRRS